MPLKVRFIIHLHLKIIYFSVLDYYCTCKSGKKQAGCCMHVAACIHYLSFARYSQIMKMPGEYLNSVLVDMDNKQSPKKPNFVKNTRTSNVNLNIFIILF
jgi:hypothetical protein